MNLHRPLHQSYWRSHTKKLEVVLGTLLEQNLDGVANKLKHYLQETCQIDRLTEISESFNGSWTTYGWVSCDGIIAVCSDQIGKVLNVIIKFRVKMFHSKNERSNYAFGMSEMVNKTRTRQNLINGKVSAQVFLSLLTHLNPH